MKTLSLEVKVLYVRVSYCPLDGNPESLCMRFPPRSIDKYFEVNGARIPPSEEVSVTLRRDRMDTESVEVTYVSTDHLQTVGNAEFEVVDKEDVLVSGSLQEVEIISKSEGLGTLVWNMECSCSVGSSGCVFTRGRHEYSLTPPTMEICLVGCCSQSPLILTRTVHLTARRRNPRCGMLDAIPEDDDEHPRKKKLSLAAVGDSEVSSMCMEGEKEEVGVGEVGKYYVREGSGGGVGYGENEDGEMSWFNAGVRVGVGIGLGMCLGVGIGVGLMVRTYQATTRSFRRRLF